MLSDLVDDGAGDRGEVLEARAALRRRLSVWSMMAELPNELTMAILTSAFGVNSLPPDAVLDACAAGRLDVYCCGLAFTTFAAG